MISADRLTVRPDGRVEYHFRRPDPTGRTSRVPSLAPLDRCAETPHRPSYP